MPVQARTPTAAELEARRLLFGSDAPDLRAALDVTRLLKRERRFDLARRLLARAAATAAGPLRREVAQQWALCTYKDPDLPAHDALDEAEQILEQQVGLGPEADVETVALAGAIEKRRFELDGVASHLERALGRYLRAHDLDLARGAAFEGYPGINAAFLLDLLASIEEREAKADGAAELSQTAQVRRGRAHELRSTIAGRLRARLAEQPDLSGNYFLLVTLGEALLGSGEIGEIHDGLSRFAEAGRLDVDDWQRETTARQLAELARTRPDSSGGFPDWARAALRALLSGTSSASEAEVALETAVRGRVGLALSGGGLRASLFHLGLLARLAELDLLRHVEVISCVSGGSILGAFYYLRLKQLLEGRSDDLRRKDYLTLVEKVEQDFLAAAQRNLRSRMSLRVADNLRRLLGGGGSTIADVFDEEMYRLADPRPSAHLMRELRIDPGSRLANAGAARADGGGHFDPRTQNWRRSAKVPMLVLNATALNTGHDWQFTASFMGESPNRIDPAVDGNFRLRRLYYGQADAASPGAGEVRLADAVAASAAVPGLFDPIAVRGVYPGKTVQLVDGGVYDNQGIDALLEQGCSVVLVSDGSGQSNARDRPSAGTGAVLLRSNSLLMSRVRIAQHQELIALRRSGALRALSFVHLKKGLTPDPIDWRNCDDPKERTAAVEARTEYGISKEVQKQLAGIRTDLDCFHEVEAFALMTSGYRIAQGDEALTAWLAETRGNAAPSTSYPWRFLAVRSALEQVYEPDPAAVAAGRLLGAASSGFGKLLRLAAPRWLRVALAASALALLFASAAALPRTIPTWSAGVAFLAGSVLLGWLLAHGRPSFAAVLAMLAAPAALLDVLLLDPIYRRLGSLARLRKLGLNDVRPAAASFPDPDDLPPTGYYQAGPPPERAAPAPSRPPQEKKQAEEAPTRSAERSAPVQLSWAAPKAVRPGSAFDLYVALHLAGDQPFLPSVLATIREAAAKVSIGYGAVVTIRLVLPPGFKADEPEAELQWLPPRTMAQFSVSVDKNVAEGRHTAKIELHAGGVRLTRFYADLRVGRDAAEVDLGALVRADAQNIPVTAFASYAHQDSVEVLRRVASLKALGIDVYVDQLGLNEGERWSSALEREILSREAFVLFWSAAAASSPYVRREWTTALDVKGLDAIRPSALDRSPPPEELKELQFGSALTALAARDH